MVNQTMTVGNATLISSVQAAIAAYAEPIMPGHGFLYPANAEGSNITRLNPGYALFSLTRGYNFVNSTYVNSATEEGTELNMLSPRRPFEREKDVLSMPWQGALREFEPTAISLGMAVESLRNPGKCSLPKNTEVTRFVRSAVQRYDRGIWHSAAQYLQFAADEAERPLQEAMLLEGAYVIVADEYKTLLARRTARAWANTARWGGRWAREFKREHRGDNSVEFRYQLRGIYGAVVAALCRGLWFAYDVPAAKRDMRLISALYFSLAKTWKKMTGLEDGQRKEDGQLTHDQLMLVSLLTLLQSPAHKLTTQENRMLQESKRVE